MPNVTTTSLPAGIEIFRAGRHIDDAGAAHDFSEQDIADIAAGYSPATHEAPLCVGHPKNNLPAYGWVAGLGARAAVLTMDTHQVDAQFSEMVSSGRYKKRSASFYPPGHPKNPTPGKWYLRHVAFLGAQPPAVPGLRDIQFSEQEDAGAVCFSELPTGTSIIQEKSTMNEEEQKRLAEAEKAAEDEKKARLKAEADVQAANKRLAEFAEQQAADRHQAHVSFCEQAVKEGRMLPAQKSAAVAVLDGLGESEPVSFAEGDATRQISPAEWVKGLISAAKPVVDFSEFAGGGAGGGESVKGLSDAEVDKRAKAYASKNAVSYSEALTAIVSFSS